MDMDKAQGKLVLYAAIYAVVALVDTEKEGHFRREGCGGGRSTNYSLKPMDLVPDVQFKGGRGHLRATAKKPDTSLRA